MVLQSRICKILKDIKIWKAHRNINKSNFNISTKSAMQIGSVKRSSILRRFLLIFNDSVITAVLTHSFKLACQKSPCFNSLVNVNIDKETDAHLC